MPGALEDIDLLILDECHHTNKEHPFNIVMRRYHNTGCMKKVLG
jgi:ERCC4-related helicase